MDVIGHTPIVELVRVNHKPKVKLYAKLEGANPGGSVKDRIAKYMIEVAERSGKINKDTIILEATSGNTGIGLAMVARFKGYKLSLIMPESMSEERKKILSLFGAELILTPAGEGMNGAIEKAREMSQDSHFFWINQFENQANVQAHYETTGQEILEQLGKVDVFVAGIGTGGTITGVGRKLKEHLPEVRVVGVEPPLNSQIQGLRCLEAYTPPIIDFSVIDEKIDVQDEQAFYLTRRLLSEEGLFVGGSSGAALYGALREVERLDEGVVVTVFPDGGFKYISTNIYFPS